MKSFCFRREYKQNGFEMLQSDMSIHLHSTAFNAPTHIHPHILAHNVAIAKPMLIDILLDHQQTTLIRFC